VGEWVGEWEVDGDKTVDAMPSGGEFPQVPRFGQKEGGMQWCSR
jgi:hypothetical protein